MDYAIQYVDKNKSKYNIECVKNLINEDNRLGIIVGKGWYHGILGWTDQLNIQDNYEGNKYYKHKTINVG